MTVYLVLACFGADVKEVIGPYAEETVAEHVADAVATHYRDGGDEYTKVVEREVREE